MSILMLKKIWLLAWLVKKGMKKLLDIWRLYQELLQVQIIILLYGWRATINTKV